jgi:hypothetical protein
MECVHGPRTIRHLRAKVSVRSYCSSCSADDRHPCDGKVNVVSDLSLRLAEGIHDLHIDQSLAPTREVLSSAYAAGSSAIISGGSSLFKAFDGVRSDISSRLEAERQRREKASQDRAIASPPVSATSEAASANNASTPVTEIGKTLGGIGSFFGSKYAAFRGQAANGTAGIGQEQARGLRPMSLNASKR